MRITRKSLALMALPAFAMLAGCETVAEEANAAIGFEYVAALTGASGTGKAEVSLNDATNTLCTDLELSAGVQMTAGHLLGPGNAVIANLDVPGAGDGSNDSEDCDSITDAQLDAIKANPAAFRIHIAATNGDLNGTLRKER
jgi:CHRD domain